MRALGRNITHHANSNYSTIGICCEKQVTDRGSKMRKILRGKKSGDEPHLSRPTVVYSVGNKSIPRYILTDAVNKQIRGLALSTPWGVNTIASPPFAVSRKGCYKTAQKSYPYPASILYANRCRTASAAFRTTGHLYCQLTVRTFRKYHNSRHRSTNTPVRIRFPRPF